MHLNEVRPYRPLPLFRADTIVQHYMQPEEFRQFHQRAQAGEAEAGAGSDAAVEVYALLVQAKVMRR